MSSTGVIAMGVSGGIIAVAIVTVIICIMAYYWIVVYKRKNGMFSQYIHTLLWSVGAENNMPSGFYEYYEVTNLNDS